MSVSTEEGRTPTKEEMIQLQEEVKNLQGDLSQLESQIESRRDLNRILLDSTKEKLSKLRLKKRKHDGLGDDHRAVKAQRHEVGPMTAGRPLCSRPMVVNKGGSVKTVRKVRVVKELGPVLPAPIWSRRSVARKKEENMCLVEFSLKDLMNHTWGWPFLQPVDPVALNLPDYFNIIKKPMDLGTVKTNVMQMHYTYFKDFVEDVRLVWKNCMAYNNSSTDIYTMAQSLHNLFEDKLKPVARFLEKNSPMYSKKYLQQQISTLTGTQARLQSQLQGLTKKSLGQSTTGVAEIQVPVVRTKEEVMKKALDRLSLPEGSELTVSEAMLTRLLRDVTNLELKYMKGLQSILQEDSHGESVFTGLVATSTPVSIDIDQLTPLTIFRIEVYLEDCTVDRIKNAPPKVQAASKTLRKEPVSSKAVRPPSRPAPSKSTMSRPQTTYKPPKKPASSNSSDFSSMSEEDFSEEETRVPVIPVKPVSKATPKSTKKSVAKPVEKKAPQVVKKVGIRITGLGQGGSQSSKPPANKAGTKPAGSTPARSSAGKAGTPARPKPGTVTKPAGTTTTPSPAPAKPTEKDAVKPSETPKTSAADAAKKAAADAEGGEGEEEAPSQSKVQTHTVGVIRKPPTTPAKSATPQTKSPQPVFSHHNIQPGQRKTPVPSQLRTSEGTVPPDMMNPMMMGMNPMMMGMNPMMMGMNPMMMGMNPMMMGMNPMMMGMGMPGGFPPPQPSAAPPGFVRSAPPPPTIRSAPPPTTSSGPPPATNPTVSSNTTTITPANVATETTTQNTNTTSNPAT